MVKRGGGTGKAKAAENEMDHAIQATAQDESWQAATCSSRPPFWPGRGPARNQIDASLTVAYMQQKRTPECTSFSFLLGYGRMGGWMDRWRWPWLVPSMQQHYAEQVATAVAFWRSLTDWEENPDPQNLLACLDIRMAPIHFLTST